jgi:hypothetical protein
MGEEFHLQSTPFFLVSAIDLLCVHARADSRASLTGIENQGLAVLPTWLVLRDHQPIEHDKNDVTLTQKRDEEQQAEKTKGNSSNKDGIVVGETRISK